MSQLSVPKDNIFRTKTRNKTKKVRKNKIQIQIQITQLPETPYLEISPQTDEPQSFDPFAESEEVDPKQATQVHVRAQQTQVRAKIGRDGKRKPHWVTTVEGLPEKFEKKKIVRHFKEALACAGNIVEDETWGEVIQLQGDCREVVFKFLTGNPGLELSESVVMIHG
ncbi:putative translation initiation factor protein [Botrytis fragariae]|uniref:Putative translation initiation factor protein n=1 Tax=Botrytis fragariae TaxID=1964551 RepID=A0A8H6ALC7_9HELO|nr:putative translation initiation factor protein [Botrytis fragariae]KAF5869494.1 putative translation initiation factor protein [Botrytis fragariae]